jgi:predicted acyl esterase
VQPTLHVATSSTDADLLVNLIDVLPDTLANLPHEESGITRAGARLFVRGKPFRAHYGRSRGRPIPFRPNVSDSRTLAMPDVQHTFQKMHRIMVQVRSTW